jgi:hypothetical protein
MGAEYQGMMGTLTIKHGKLPLAESTASASQVDNRPSNSAIPIGKEALWSVTLEQSDATRQKGDNMEDAYAVYNSTTQRMEWYANLIGHEVVVTEEVALYSERSQEDGR